MAKAALFHSAITPDLSEIFLESRKGSHWCYMQPTRQQPMPEALNHRVHRHLLRVCGFGTVFPDINITTGGSIYN